MLTITEIKTPVWKTPDHTVLNVTIVTVEEGAVPFTTAQGATGDLEAEIWAKALNGDYGQIAEYIAPPELTPEEKRAMMPKLEKWRVDTVIDLETGLRDKINAAIAKWPDPKRTIAKNKLASVTVFDRLDPLFDELGSEPEVGKTPDDIDIMWTAGAALPPALT